MRLAFLGDIGLFGKNSYNKETTKERFQAVKEVLSDCDYVIGNLETPLTNDKKTIGGKSAYIKGKPEDVETLQFLGVTHVSLANNHVLDYTYHGLEETINVLERNNIKWYGIKGKTESIISGGNKLMLYGYCCISTNGKGLLGRKAPVNLFAPRETESKINAASKEGFFPILSVHWGEEHVAYPNFYHLRIARHLASGNSFILHGHHPHVIQGIEQINNSLLAYSLGNFCFDDVYTSKSNAPLVALSKDNKETFILIVELDKNQIIKKDIVPISFVDDSYSINNEVHDKIKKRSELLNLEKEEYVSNRSHDIRQYLDNRKKMRDLNWYLKRLTPDTLKMLICAKINQHYFKKHIISFCNQISK